LVPNMPHAFKDRDIQRVIRAARSAGLDPTAVQVDPKTGRITVMKRAADTPDATNPWDTAVADLERRT
jgi:hypothetical protein